MDDSTPQYIDPPAPTSPACPDCDRQRMTACPVCGSSGLNFYYTSAGLTSDTQATDDRPAMLICRTCDEAFVPDYPRMCEWCGHDFGTGTEIEAAGEPIEMMSGRVMATIIGLAALLMGIAAYFALLF